MTNTSQAEKALRFKSLHERSGAFVIPNPWDAGSAHLFSKLGFEALATTSSGFARSLGRQDYMVTLDEKLEHIRHLGEAVDIPISADLENGFADDPEAVAETIRRAADAGAVGGSIEDHTRNPDRPIYDFDLAVERVHAAVEAAGALDFSFTLTARSENFLWGREDIEDTIRRLQAFEAAGADVLYAPGLRTPSEVQTVTASLTRPVNVLGPYVMGATLEQLAEAGARRVSVGGALYGLPQEALRSAAVEMLEEGSFSWFKPSQP